MMPIAASGRGTVIAFVRELTDQKGATNEQLGLRWFCRNIRLSEQQHPLGRCYLYLAHRQGRCIRLAYADGLTGPWKIYEAGA